MYLNKAIIIGNLTRDPELRSIPSGAKVASFSVATNRVWKDRNGVRQDSTDYHNVVVFGVQAEHVSQYLRKGSSVLVEGRMQTRSWDDKDGTKKYRTEIIADRVQFGPKPQGGASESSGGYSQAPQSSQQASGGAKKPEIDTIQYPDEEINLEDIPF